MDDRQNNDIAANSEENVSEAAINSDNEKNRKRYKKTVKFKNGFLAAIVILFALPFLLTDLRMEDSFIFVLAIILLVIFGIGYIFTLIKSIRLRKKANTDDTVSGSQRTEILCLPVIIAIYSLTAFIADGLYSTTYGSLMLEFYFIIGFGFLILDLLVSDLRKNLKSKTVQLSLIAFVPEFVIATVGEISVLPAFSVSALLVAVASVILYKNPGKLTGRPFTKKQFQHCFASASAVFVLFCALSIASSVVTDKRMEGMRLKLDADLNQKIFVSESEDAYPRVYIFDEDCTYYSLSGYENESETRYSVYIDIDWFGFGAFRFKSPFNELSYDSDGDVIALIKEYDGTETVYRLSDSIPCLKHEFGEYVITKEAVSCQEPGSKKRTCTKCGYEEISTIAGEHTYVNGTCTVCGKKKPVEKGQLEANTWYTYKPLPQLKLQNCIVIDATPAQKGLLILYQPECSHCDAIGVRAMASLTDEETISYYCPECGGSTVIVFKIDY